MNKMKVDYVVKPRNIFKHPFNKFDLDKPGNRESQNQDITDYFNYGFNEDTMNVYVKLVKRTIQALDDNVIAQSLNKQPNLLRLNDQIPMDFGGFCRFFDPSVFSSGNDEDDKSQENEGTMDEGEKMFSYLIYRVTKMRDEYPLIDFVKSLYQIEGETNEIQMCDFMDRIEANFERKYQETMAKLRKKEEAKSIPPKQEQKPKPLRENSKKQEKSESSSSSDSQDSSESNHSRHKKKERSRDKKSRKGRSKDKSRRSKRDKSRERSKKKNKDRKNRNKSHRHSKDKKRKHDSHDRSKHKRKDRKSKFNND